MPGRNPRTQGLSRTIGLSRVEKGLAILLLTNHRDILLIGSLSVVSILDSFEKSETDMLGGSNGEHPPPYRQHNDTIHGLETPTQHKPWRRRSFPKHLVRRHSDRKDTDTHSIPKRGPALPSSSRNSIEQEWSELREAQEQVREDRQALERDKAAHEARVRYELEQLGKDIAEERRRFGYRGNAGGYYCFLPRGPSSQEEEEEEDDDDDFWFGEYGYPPHDYYWGMNGEADAPNYDDIAGEGFTNWESDDDEPGSFANPSYRACCREDPPRYRYSDFNESNHAWEDETPTPHEQPRHWKQKCEETKKAYEAYIDKWKTISATDSLIPYPTADLASAPLLDSPEINIDVPLSKDQTIELNSTIFFLLAFNLQSNTITNTAGSPKIELCPRADLDQVRALQKQMKIERIRWHPDSLVKRRTDGMVREAESKGVYRAVDELLEECKVRLGGR
jgi:hypothetical protein